MQHDFRYVSKNEAKEVKKALLDIIHEVQDIVREHFTFSYLFIGSSDRIRLFSKIFLTKMYLVLVFF